MAQIDRIRRAQGGRLKTARISAACAAAYLVLLGASPSSSAEPVHEAEEALRKRDVAGALKILTEASDSGSMPARATLASYLRNFPPPYRDAEKGCKLARETADAGETMGMVTRAECLLAGTEKSEQPYATARELTRRAWKAGSPAGAFMHYVVFSQDPQYSYMNNGVVDNAKYAALAAMPLSARGDQIEAYEALADAIRGGHVNALMVAMAYLVESSAPGNIGRVLGAAGLLQKNGEQVPQRLRPIVKMAEEIKTLGVTHASPVAFRNAYSTAVLLVGAELKRAGKSTCDVDKMKLASVNAEPVAGAEYLPIPMPLANTYLVRGNWNETWTFTGCDSVMPIQLAFTADGWSGAKFRATKLPQ